MSTPTLTWPDAFCGELRDADAAPSSATRVCTLYALNPGYQTLDTGHWTLNPKPYTRAGPQLLPVPR
jgi:hypothetical protein